MKFKTCWYGGPYFIGFMIFLLVLMFTCEIYISACYLSEAIRFPEVDNLSYMGLATTWLMIGALELVICFIYYEYLRCSHTILMTIVVLLGLAGTGATIYGLRTIRFNQEFAKRFRERLEAMVTQENEVPESIRHFQQKNKCCLLFGYRTAWYSNLPESRKVYVAAGVSYPLSCCRELLPCQMITQFPDPNPQPDEVYVYTDYCGIKIRKYLDSYLITFQTHMWAYIFFAFLSLAIYGYYIGINRMDEVSGKSKRKFKPLHFKWKRKRKHREIKHDEEDGSWDDDDDDEIEDENQDRARIESSSDNFIRTESYKGFKWKSLIKQTRKSIGGADAVLLHQRFNKDAGAGADTEVSQESPEQHIYLLHIGNTKY